MTDFWAVHGWLFLFGLAFFPRLTMLFAVATPFGWLAWVGFVLWPSLLVAVLATGLYWHTNPMLCVLAWLVVVSKGSASSQAVEANDYRQPVQRR